MPVIRGSISTLSPMVPARYQIPAGPFSRIYPIALSEKRNRGFLVQLIGGDVSGIIEPISWNDWRMYGQFGAAFFEWNPGSSYTIMTNDTDQVGIVVWSTGKTNVTVDYWMTYDIAT